MHLSLTKKVVMFFLCGRAHNKSGMMSSHCLALSHFEIKTRIPIHRILPRTENMIEEMDTKSKCHN